MKICQLETENGFCADRIEIADSYLTRLKGLMFRKALGKGEGLLLKKCSSIHCCFMNFPIDVVYLCDKMEVLKVETVRPWRVGSIVRGAKHILELPEGAASGLRRGDRIIMKEVDTRNVQ